MYVHSHHSTLIGAFLHRWRFGPKGAWIEFYAGSEMRQSLWNHRIYFVRKRRYRIVS